MQRKNVVIAVISIMILFAVIFALVSVFSSNATIQPLIQSTIKLRSNLDDPVLRAKAITELNDIVQELDSPGINEGWTVMASCVPTAEGCSDDDFMNFIISAVNDREKDLTYGAVVQDIIVVHRYWGDSENVIQFSQALTNVNTGISEMHASSAMNLWNKIIECNGVCPEYDNLFFELVEVISQL
jgi:hypothetical protein